MSDEVEAIVDVVQAQALARLERLERTARRAIVAHVEGPRPDARMLILDGAGVAGWCAGFVCPWPLEVQPDPEHWLKAFEELEDRGLVADLEDLGGAK